MVAVPIVKLKKKGIDLFLQFGSYKNPDLSFALKAPAGRFADAAFLKTIVLAESKVIDLGLAETFQEKIATCLEHWIKCSGYPR